MRSATFAWRLLLQLLVTNDEYRISSLIGPGSAVGEWYIDLPTGGDGLEQKPGGFAGLGLEVLPILQALADKHWMGEDHDRSQDQVRRCARVDRLEFAGLDPIAQDQLYDVAQDV